MDGPQYGKVPLGRLRWLVFGACVRAVVGWLLGLNYFPENAHLLLRSFSECPFAFCVSFVARSTYLAFLFVCKPLLGGLLS